MKKLILTLAFVVAAAFIAMPSYAVIVDEDTDVNFFATAHIPTATSVSIAAVKRLGSDDSPVEEDVTQLDFNTGGNLVYKPTLGIFLSDYYFAIDVGVGDGVGAIGSVTTSYSDTGAPQAVGLGSRATATFVKAVVSGTETSIGPGKVMLSSLAGGTEISSTAWTGGWFRLYIGIYDGSVAALNTGDAGPFTGDDAVGTYTGTITLSATLQ